MGWWRPTEAERWFLTRELYDSLFLTCPVRGPVELLLLNFITRWYSIGAHASAASCFALYVMQLVEEKGFQYLVFSSSCFWPGRSRAFFFCKLLVHFGIEINTVQLTHGKWGVVLERVLNAPGCRASYKKNRMGYGAWVGCDSEFHACGDHQTAMITKTQ